MNDEMKAETIETCVTACEKYSSNNEVNINNHRFSINFTNHFITLYHQNKSLYRQPQE